MIVEGASGTAQGYFGTARDNSANFARPFASPASGVARETVSPVETWTARTALGIGRVWNRPPLTATARRARRAPWVSLARWLDRHGHHC